MKQNILYESTIKDKKTIFMDCTMQWCNTANWIFQGFCWGVEEWLVLVKSQYRNIFDSIGEDNNTILISLSFPFIAEFFYVVSVYDHKLLGNDNLAFLFKHIVVEINDFVSMFVNISISISLYYILIAFYNYVNVTFFMSSSHRFFKYSLKREFKEMKN